MHLLVLHAEKIVFTAEDAEREGIGGKGEKVVLVRLETSPEDITGMKASQGILTVRGGMTSHAAVVARGMGTCCVSGCGDIAMDEENKNLLLLEKHSMKEIISQLMVLLDAFMMELSQRLMLQSWGNLKELCLGQINLEDFVLELMLILQEMLKKLMNLVLKVLDFAVLSICSSKKIELLHLGK